MCLVTTSLKFSPKVKATPSTRAVHLTEMSPTLVLVSRGVDPIIRHLLHFLPNLYQQCHQLGEEHNFLLDTQLDKSHPIP